MPSAIHVLGFGAVGSVITAYLLAAGRKPVVVARRTRVLELREYDRLRLERAGQTAEESAGMVLPAPEFTADPDYSRTTHLFICVKREQLPDVLQSLSGKLPPSCRVLPCVNGLDADKEVAAVLPDQPCSVVSVMANMRQLGPMQVRLTTAPELQIANADKATLALFRGTGLKAQAGGDAHIRGKLLINLNNAICALCDRSFADIFIDPELRRVYVAALDEAVGVYEAAGLDYTMPAPVSYALYRWVLIRAPGIPLWIARKRNGLSDEAYPSMCADLAAGRRTEVVYLNGAIVQLADAHGADAPINRSLVKLIQAREQATDSAPLSPAELAAQLEIA